MKLKYFAVLALLIILAACNPTLPPPPPGWNLELRAGTTNIDHSFFLSTDSETTRTKADEAHFRQLRAEILKKIPNFKLGSQLANGFTTNTRTTKTNTRETYGLAVSLFLAVTKDGLPPKSDLSFVYSGPKGTYDKPVVYPAGNAWIAEPFVIPEGNGSYTFSSTLQDGTLAASVDLNLLDESKWLPLPQAANDVTGL